MTLVSPIRFIKGILSLIAQDIAEYFASVVDSAVSVCNLFCIKTGQPAYHMTNPALKYTVSAPLAFSGSHAKAKSASKYVSSPLLGSGE